MDKGDIVVKAFARNVLVTQKDVDHDIYTIRNNKSKLKQIRRDGNFPAVIYSAGNSESLTIEGKAFDILLKTRKDFLSTTPLAIEVYADEKATKPLHTKRALIKEVQYDVTSPRVLHIDFIELVNRKITVKVPVRIFGEEGCKVVSQGGAVRVMVRKVGVRCEPKDLPKEFALNVKDLELGKAKRVKDLVVPEGVEMLPEGVVPLVIGAKR